MKNSLKKYNSICIIGGKSDLSKFLKTFYYHSEKALLIENKFKFCLEEILNLIDKYDYFFVDDSLVYLNREEKKKLFKNLKDKAKKIIYVSTNSEDVLFSDYLIVLNKNKVAIEGSTLAVLKEEKILKRLGIKLPFIVDLSIQLNYYNLVDKIYTNNEELINVLWK